MLINYCCNCGILIPHSADPELELQKCLDCKAGRAKPADKPRDSGRIPYALLLSAAAFKPQAAKL